MKKMMIGRNAKVGGYAVLVCDVKAMEQITKMIDEENNPVVSYQVFGQDEALLTDLPEDVQAEVKKVLRAYDRCNVVYENNKFSVGTGCCLKSTYAWDHFVVNEYKAHDVYTPEERRQNFVEEFGYAPLHI